MKLAFFLVAAFGAASASFKANEESVFKYHGKILTGIPELEDVFSGMAVDASVIVQAGSNPNPYSNNYKIALKDVKIRNFNEKLRENGHHTDGGWTPRNWRHMETPSTSPVPEEFKAHLEAPIEVQMENGEMRRMTVSSEEPEWSINFKKALVAAVKMKLPQQEERSNRISRGEAPISDTWSVMEQGIDGVCENFYQLTEVPQYLISEVERKLLKPEFCVGKKMFQVIRTRDITKCLSRTLYVASRQHEDCIVGNCDGVNGKTSETRFIGCGESKENLQIVSVIHEGELKQSVLAFNTEKIVTGTKLVLKLAEVKPTKTALPDIQTPRVVEDVLYEYPKDITPEERRQITSLRKQQDYYMNKAQDPKSLVVNPVGKLRAMNDQMKSKIVEKLSVAARDMENMEDFGEKKVPNQLKALKSVISVLSVQNLKDIYAEVKPRKTERRLFLETLIMAGTNPCIMFAKEMIMSRELSLLEAAEVIITLPHYIKTPTSKIVEELFELIKSPVLTSSKLLKANAQLAFATIVRSACISMDDSKAMYPENMVGKMCSPNDPKITNEYIPHFVAELKSSDKSDVQAAVISLNALSHPAVIPIILPYIEGRVANEENSSIRKIAIYSMTPMAFRHRDVLLPVFSKLLQDRAEEREVRVAALLTMLTMEPTLVDMQRMAISTWYEKDEKLARFVFSSLKSLSQLEPSKVPAHSRLMRLHVFAKKVFHLAKPFPAVISSTINSFFADVLKDLEIGYQSQSVFMTSHRSISHYYKVDNFLKKAKTTPFEYAVEVAGIKSFAVEAVKIIASEYDQKVHDELEKIIEKLEIAPRVDSVLEAGLWLRQGDDIQVVAGTSLVNTEQMKEKLRTIVREHPNWMEEAKRKVCGNTPFQLHKAFQTLPYMAMVPSDMGFPIMVESQATFLFAVKGKVDVDCSAPGLPAISIENTKKMAYSLSTYAGTVSPFTEELLAAGVDANRAINIPFKADIKVEPRTGTLKVDMKQLDEVTPQTTRVDFHHYHMIPFTTKKPVVFADMTPIVLDHTNTKVLKSSSPKKSFEKKIGESLGLDVTFEVQSEADVLDKETVLDVLKKYKYNPYAIWMFLGTETALKADGQPTLRYHKYSLVHNPKDSTTKQLKAEIKVAAAIKENGRDIIHHIAMESEKKTEQEQRLTQSILELGSEDAYTANLMVDVSLVGGSPKTYKMSMTTANGFGEVERKWNVKMEMENGSEAKKVCSTGKIEIPLHRENQDKFKFESHTGFGRSCEEYTVNIDGFALPSEEQKEYGRNSHAARKCALLSRKVHEQHQHVKTLPKSQRKSWLQEELAQLRKEEQIVCEEKVKEATTLDKVEFDLTVSPNLPTSLAKYVDAVLKAMLLEYIPRLPIQRQSSEKAVKAILQFNQEKNSVTMKVVSPKDITEYKDIRLPRWTKKVIPMTYARSPVEQVYEGLTNTPLYSKCTVFDGQIKTFDNKMYSYDLDDCNHLVAADCIKKSHAVVAKQKNNVKFITIYHEDTKIELQQPASRYQSSRTPYQVIVDGVRKVVGAEETITFMSKDAKSIYNIHWSDSRITVNTPTNRVQYNGKNLIVEDKDIISGLQCGLCGDNNQDRRGDLKSSNQYVYRTIKTMAHSYRINDSQCISRISPSETRELQSSKSVCSLASPEAGPSEYDIFNENNSEETGSTSEELTAQINAQYVHFAQKYGWGPLEVESRSRTFAMKPTPGLIIDSAGKIIDILGKVKDVVLGELEREIYQIKLDIEGIEHEERELVRMSLEEIYNAADNVMNAKTELENLAKDTIDQVNQLKNYYSKVKDDWDQHRLTLFIKFEAKKMSAFLKRSTDKIKEALNLYDETQRHLNTVRAHLEEFQKTVEALADHNSEAFKKRKSDMRKKYYLPCCTPCPDCCITCAATLKTKIKEWSRQVDNLNGVLRRNDQITGGLLKDVKEIHDFVAVDVKLVIEWNAQLAKVGSIDFTIPEAEIVGFKDSIEPVVKSLDSLKGAATNYLKSHGISITPAISSCSVTSTRQPQRQPERLPARQPSMKHIISHQTGKICFSKEMKPQCFRKEVPRLEMTESVEVVCVSSSRPQIKEWVNLAERREEIPDLKSMERSFETSVKIPQFCTQY